MADYVVMADKILVLRDSKPDDSGGIILTDDIKKPPCKGTVQSVGDEVKYYAVGDRVVFTEYAGYFLKTASDLEDTDLIVMREDEILAKEVIEDATT
jgi:co-chaperonin GroES (HSP10)